MVISLKLDDEQKEAISSNSSSLIIAGPGSGKTRCITAKALSLALKNKKFIALTFTRSAAREMVRRGLTASTIHAYCLNELQKRYNYEFNDYEDLLSDFLEIRYKQKYSWVLVDEVQDLNPQELDVIKSIMVDNIFAVGDPYQSIYGFGGSLGLEITKELGVNSLTLKNNYRSTPYIVSRLNKIFNRELVSQRSFVKPEITAIFTRTNAEADQIEEILIGENVPIIRKRKGGRFPGEIITKGFKGVSIMTAHCCKGLEFSKVHILAWKDMKNEPNLYYVAASRAETYFELHASIGDLVDSII